MKFKKVMALSMAAVMAASLAACGSSDTTDTQTTGAETAETTEATEATEATETTEDSASADGSLQYKDVVLGETGTDITTTIKVLSHRTDMLTDDYNGTSWADYVAAFNEQYPGITVEIEGITDYANDALLRLQGEDWGDIMMIPAVTKADLATYFMSYGTEEDVSALVNYTTNWTYNGEVYGIPTTANAQGIVYNKRIFEEAGVTELPKTPEEFIAALQAVKDYDSSIVPLYTNYAANWTLGAWDAYISGGATGLSSWTNDSLIHGSNPFADPGDGTGAYNVYKILYDAVAAGLTEDDFSTTDWESSKTMINNGEIATMVLGSWAVPQMQGAGENADDIGYMPFPITVDGKQYAAAGPDYNFGINVNSDDTNKLASLIFVKWMTEESGFSYNEGGLPIAADDTNVPDIYQAFTDAGVTYVVDDPAIEGEEDLMNELNSESSLNVNNGGNDKVAAIIEDASTQSRTFDEIMEEWNATWTEAQEIVGVTVNE